MGTQVYPIRGTLHRVEALVATLKRGVRLPRGSYLEIEVDGATWRVKRGEHGNVTFEILGFEGFAEVLNPPESVELLWELIESDAVGNGPH